MGLAVVRAGRPAAEGAPSPDERLSLFACFGELRMWSVCKVRTGWVAVRAMMGLLATRAVRKVAAAVVGARVTGGAR